MKIFLSTFFLTCCIAFSITAQLGVNEEKKNEEHDLAKLQTSKELVVTDVNNKLGDLRNEKAQKEVDINPKNTKDKLDDTVAASKTITKRYNFPYNFGDDLKVYSRDGDTKIPNDLVQDENMILKYVGRIDDVAKEAFFVENKNSIYVIKEDRKTPMSLYNAILYNIFEFK